MICLYMEISVTSDYHTASGYGQGAVCDSRLARDDEGRPVLRGTMLAGLLREGAEVLAAAGAISLEDVDAVFGTAGKPKDIIISSAVSKQRRRDDTIGPVARRTKIDPRSRRADDKKQFMIEEEGDISFQFKLRCSTIKAAVIATAAARMVRGLGASRRRGKGECIFRVVKAEGLDIPTNQQAQDWLLERFSELDTLQETETAATGFSWPSDEELAEESPLRVRVFVRLEEPLIVSRRAAAGNNFETLSYIPGNVLWGALASRAFLRNSCVERGVTEKQLIKLFKRGLLSIPALYPVEEEGKNLFPAIPMPLDLGWCEIYGSIHPPVQYQGEDMPECSICHAEMKNAGEYLVQKGSPQKYSVARRLEMHNSIDDRSGRVNNGELFGYAVLNEGQLFVGDIVVRNKYVWEVLRQATGLADTWELWLGKGRRRGYGHVRGIWMLADQVNGGAEDIFVRTPLSQRVSNAHAQLSMLVLSDVILRDVWGRYAASLDTPVTAEIMQESLTNMSGAAEVAVKVVPQSGVSRYRVLDSFHSKHGLPRQRDIAIIAGSTVGIELSGDEAEIRKAISHWETWGIGLRREEGFGRVVFQHPVYTKNSNNNLNAAFLACLNQANVLESRNDWNSNCIRASNRIEISENWKKAKQKLSSMSEKDRSQWRAVARILRQAAGRGWELVKLDLEQLKQPAAIIPEDIRNRDKEQYFAKGGKELLNAIIAIGENVCEGENPQGQTAHIHILADKIHQAVDDGDGER